MNAFSLFEVFQSRHNQQRYVRLKAPSKEIICSPEGYAIRANVERDMDRKTAGAPRAQTRVL